MIGARVRARVRAWLGRRIRPEPGPVVLEGRRIYIMPDRNGVLFGGVFGIMLLGAMNENLNLGFAVAALLSAVLFVSILHTYRNINRLWISMAAARPVFAGEVVRFPVVLREVEGIGRHALGLQGGIGVLPDEAQAGLADLEPGGQARLTLFRPSAHRGWLAAGPFTLFTRYPLGVIQAWSHMDLEARCLVYPRPEPGDVPLPFGGSSDDPGESLGRDGDDFVGLRGYRPEDSPRHVHWRVSARREALLTKQFGGEPPLRVWLEWDGLAGLGEEARLSRLCRWVLDAHRGGLAFGLRLPGVVLPPESGETQRRRCLEALALFRLDGG